MRRKTNLDSRKIGDDFPATLKRGKKVNTEIVVPDQWKKAGRAER